MKALGWSVSVVVVIVGAALIVGSQYEDVEREAAYDQAGLEQAEQAADERSQFMSTVQQNDPAVTADQEDEYFARGEEACRQLDAGMGPRGAMGVESWDHRTPALIAVAAVETLCPSYTEELNLWLEESTLH
jgi:hypothetical protein